MKSPKLYNLSERSKKNAILFQQPSLAKQEFKDECDIKSIMAKFEKTGVLDHQAKHEGRYGDFTTAPQYHEAMNIVAEADDMFKSIPSHIRALFSNDASEFLEFAQNPDNVEDMIEMGLAKRPPVLSTDEKVVTPTPTTNEALEPLKTSSKEALDG